MKPKPQYSNLAHPAYLKQMQINEESQAQRQPQDREPIVVRMLIFAAVATALVWAYSVLL